MLPIQASSGLQLPEKDGVTLFLLDVLVRWWLRVQGTTYHMESCQLRSPLSPAVGKGFLAVK